MEPTLRTTEIVAMAVPPTSAVEARDSAVSWAAILGGAFAGMAVSLILLALGAGFGLSVVSPFGGTTSHGTAMGAAAVGWLVVTQILSAALGGYLAGRLRTKWTGVHHDETHFRDTVHGFLAWAVAALLSATILGASLISLTGAPAQTATGTGATANEGPAAYYVDELLRGQAGVAPANDAVRAQAGRLFTRLVVQSDATDQQYLTQMVSQVAGLPPVQAAERVDSTLLAAKQAADTARKETARFLMWVSLGLLIAAFVSSHMATIGGRQRMRAEVA